MLAFIDKLSDLRLDIVGIVAVLGEGCTSRTLQVSALSWPHVFPRLLPAPQALLRYEQENRLPVSDGIVIGAYSGNTKHELNFFCQLLHGAPPAQNTVELLKVTHHLDPPCRTGQAFGVRTYSWLAVLSIFGMLIAFFMIGLAVHFNDGFALVATTALAATSSIVGVASWWTLDFEEQKPQKEQKEREDIIPHSDVIIYYPIGSSRVVRCESEAIARLYFKKERCIQIAGDNVYRIAALLASVLLMGGLLCMGNAQTKMQITFASSYILLNVLHWAVSALNPLHYHWQHNYVIGELKFNRPKKTPVAKLATGPDDKVHVNGMTTSTNDGNGSAVASGAQAPLSPTSDTFPNGSPNDIHLTNLTRRKTGGVTFDIPKPASDQNPSPLHRKGTDIERQRLPPPPVPPHTFSNRIRRASSTLSNSSPKQPEEQNDEDRNFTAALWQVIALTGTSRWLRNTHIAPNTDVWDEWIRTAGARAQTKIVTYKDKDGSIQTGSNKHGKTLIPAATKKDESAPIDLPIWDYQGALNSMFAKEKQSSKQRPPSPDPFEAPDVDLLSDKVKVKLIAAAERARQVAGTRRDDVRRQIAARQAVDAFTQAGIKHREIVKSATSSSNGSANNNNSGGGGKKGVLKLKTPTLKNLYQPKHEDARHTSTKVSTDLSKKFVAGNGKSGVIEPQHGRVTQLQAVDDKKQATSSILEVPSKQKGDDKDNDGGAVSSSSSTQV